MNLLSLFVGAAAIQVQPTLPPGWEDVQLVGWEVVAENVTRDGLTLARRSESVGKVWVRSESRRGGRTSFVGLVEIRCDTREQRTERGEWYNGPNLTQYDRQMNPSVEWQPVLPGSGGAALLDYACMPPPVTLLIEPVRPEDRIEGVPRS